MDRLARYDKTDLWIFTYEKGRARFKDYEQYCNNGRFQKGFRSNLNKQRMNQYLKELHEEKKIAWGVDDAEGFKYSYVPPQMINEVKELKIKRQAEEEFRKLRPEEQARILSESSREAEKKQIMNTLALNGWLSIQEIAAKTGLDEGKVLDALWGTQKEPSLPLTQNMFTSLINRGYIDTDKNYKLPVRLRRYGLSFAGLYWALKEYPESLDAIVEKWGNIHPFVFERFQVFRNHDLEGVLKEFFQELDPINFHFIKDEAIKEVENRLIDFIPRRGGHTLNWFKVIHEDRQFRDRVRARYNERLESYKRGMRNHKRALKIIDKLAASKPNWEELNWEVGFFVVLM
jgi:hypothetical protein